MKLDRRNFIKVMGATTGALMLPCSTAIAAPHNSASDAESIGMLTDLTKCIGCGLCQQACSDWNKLAAKTAVEPGEDPAPCLSADTWTLPESRQVEEGGGVHQVFVKRQCMHCLNPACVSACPVGALHQLDSGAVVYDRTRCIGCRYCMVACPFSIPKFQWDETLPCIRKCTFCSDRQEQGMEPACAAACPTGALTFGRREDLIAEAQARIQAQPDLYVPHVYGQHELGGTSWMYISPVPFEEIGFPELKDEPVTKLSEAFATYGTAGVAASVTAALGGLYYLFQGRESIEIDAHSDESQEESE